MSKQEIGDMAGRQADFGRRKESNEPQVDAVDMESDCGELLSSDDRSADWTTDLRSIVLLLILYTLQGIPMGLSGSMPFLLLEKVQNLIGQAPQCACFTIRSGVKTTFPTIHRKATDIGQKVSSGFVFFVSVGKILV